MKRIMTWMLIAALLLCTVGCIQISCTAPIRYSNADQYTAGDFTYEASAVNKVEIEWIAGSVTLKNGAGTLSVSESGKDTLTEEQQMHWWLDGTTLRIRFCKSGYRYPLDKVFNEKKDLTVELPDFVDLDLDVASGKVQSESMLNLGTFKLNTASGGTDIRLLTADDVKVDAASGKTAFGAVSVSGDFEVDTASGGLTVDAIAADKVDIDTASGGLTIGDVTAKTVKIDSASGGVTLGVREAETVKISSASGSVRVTLFDKAAGAKIRHSAVSGNFNTSLSGVNSGNVLTVGEGAIDMDISIVSGSVTVE